MKIHYDPFKSSYDPYDEESSERGYRGTLLSEYEDNSTNNKEYVTCKRCIKAFSKADKEMEMHHKHFADDCQGFMDFIETEGYGKN